MTNRTLVIMGVVLTLLVGTYILQKTSDRRPRAAGTSENAIGGSWKADAVARIEVYRGKPEEAVVVRKKGEAWTLPKTFDSAGDKSKIERFLDGLREMQGTPRGNDAAIHKNFGLESESALHIVLYDADGKEIEHWLSGKRAPGYDQSFVRRASNHEVYVANRDLGRAVGLADDTGRPAAPAWLDLAVTQLEKKKLTSVQISSPGVQLSFQRKEKPSEEKPADPKEEKKEEKKEKEYEWIHATAGLSYPGKTEGVGAMLDAICAVKAEDVADPAKVAEYGLAAPTYRVAVGLEDKEPLELRVGAEVPGKADHYYAQAGRQGPIFVLGRSTIDGIFKKGKDLLELPSPVLPRRARKIVISGPHRDIVLEVARNGWMITTPSINRGPTMDHLQTFATRIADYTPEDVTVSVDPKSTGLDNPEHRIVFEDDRQPLEIRIGAKAPGKTPRRFMAMSEAEGIFIIPESDLESLSPKLKDLVDYRPVRVDRDMVRQIQAVVEGETVTLERAEMWECKVKGIPLAGNPTGIDPYLEFVTSIQPIDVLNKVKVDKPEQQLVFVLDDGTRLELDLGKKDGRAWVRHKGTVYQIDEGTYHRPEGKLGTIMERILFKRRDDIESVGMKIDAVEKAMDKSRLPTLGVEEIVGMDRRAESGIDASKTTLTIKVKSVRQAAEYVFVFGVQKGDCRYVWLKGSDGLMLIKEELYQSLIK